MAFCTRCGSSMSDTTAVCPNCGQVRNVSGFAQPASAAPPPTGKVPGGGAFGTIPPPSATPGATGFLGALFDFSFTSFVTTKLIKTLYALGVIIAGFAALMLVIAGFTKGVLAGLLVLIIVAPLVFFLYVIYWRVVMELIIVIFRAAENLGELVQQGRRT